MEFCGGGSLQDIYHSKSFINGTKTKEVLFYFQKINVKREESFSSITTFASVSVKIPVV